MDRRAAREQRGQAHAACHSLVPTLVVQTGSGKTHSLGILTRVAGESGIIPRALSHVFGAIAQEEASGTGRVFAVTASFAQIYLDTVQDLLVQGGGGDAAAGGGGGTSLPVREDPVRGFYVEGLSEYAVRSFDEATALLNWGLEHRVLGATRMNATSSRSHTILTVRVEVRVPATGARLDAPDVAGGATATAAGSSSSGGGGGALTGHVATRAQLMICDLAGSERVRRTSSRGARLDEARAINGSLHTLGQVIAVRRGGASDSNQYLRFFPLSLHAHSRPSRRSRRRPQQQLRMAAVPPLPPRRLASTSRGATRS